MLVVHNNTEEIEWGTVSSVRPLEYKGDLVVVFDPSKTNMAFMCGTPDGTLLDIYEFSGNNRRKGPAMDTTVYCAQIRRFLKEYLSKAHLLLAVVEQAITVKGPKSNHISNMALTEIRSNLLNFFYEEFGIRAIELNNWAWKAAILPEGYRSLVAKGDAKGSKRWLQDFAPESQLGKYFESDVSDCFCMYLYVVRNYCKGYVMHCDKSETCDYNFNWIYTPIGSALLKDKKELPYNPRFSIQDNVHYYLNRVATKFYMKTPIEVLSILTIPQHSLLFSYEHIVDKEVACIVWRI